ncbi:glycoside hydrolase family 3 protein [Breznakiella homolactica]|uniref:beta-N-acetylhexosaminidase n=1 Tax=Breznakiella homolactica TaxID=2798577 RepID=A0A7T7XN68_9SPIR|nr:glycoside hydrolase family 3 N-terminal domain-containing protein [Breznakiella homolactica]QQO09383.1 hypothetical protein JFL75_00220 [Breznakiella homolactica]
MNIDITAKPFNLNEQACVWVRDTLKAMTEEEKIGQVFCGILWDKPGTRAEALFEDIAPGAIMYRPFASAKMRDYSLKLQALSKIPLLIACNLERGGSGGNGGMADGTYFSSPMGVAATDEYEQALRLGRIAAREGNAAGINWTFEPIIDIDINPENPITNVRTFGSDTDRIITMAKGYCDGCAENAMAVCIKHFPGDGVDYRDQHLMASINSLSAEEWFETYGKVYRALIGHGAQTLMSAHIKQPALSRSINPALTDGEILPGSLSRELNQGIVRERLGFNGVICTDATQMVGFTAAMKREDAIPMAIENGADMLIFSINQKEDAGSLRRGIARGILSRERLDAAVLRILALKASLGLHEKQRSGTLVPEPSAMEWIRCEEHRAWARECAGKNITLVKNQENLLPLSPDKTPKVALLQITNERCQGKLPEVELFAGLLRKEGFSVSYLDEIPLPGPEYPVSEFKKNVDLIVYYANMKVGSNQTTIRLVWDDFLGETSPKYVCDIPTLFLSFSNPYHLVDVPMIKTYINAYASHPPAVEAAVEKLMGRSAFTGVSPVDPFAGLWDTRL